MEQKEYAKTDSTGAVIEYPVYEHHIHNRGHLIRSYEFVHPLAKPEFDEVTQTVAKRKAQRGEDGKLYQVWEVSQKTAQLYGRDLLEVTTRDTNNAIAALKAGYPEQETETWTLQRIEAERWQADNNASVPTLVRIAERRGVPLNLLAAKILEKSQAYSVLLGMILGDRQAIEDVVLALEGSTPVDWIAQLDQLRQGWRADWPTELKEKAQ